MPIPLPVQVYAVAGHVLASIAVVCAQQGRRWGYDAILDLLLKLYKFPQFSISRCVFVFFFVFLGVCVVVVGGGSGGGGVWGGVGTILDLLLKLYKSPGSASASALFPSCAWGPWSSTEGSSIADYLHWFAWPWQPA
jgi:hypothetical protein